MKFKDFMKTQMFVRKFYKQKLRLQKKNDMLTESINALHTENELLKQELNIAQNRPPITKVVHVENTQSIVMTLLLSVLTFGFLKCVNYLQTIHVESSIDIDNISYCIVTLHILYMCLYIQYFYA